jgi:regulator of sigma E protease
MISDIAIFIIFLCPLVFFHELGHFLIARLCGVRVEVFSIGFGPKLFKWKKGDTEYAFSLIPLGGYVKMFGDDPFKKDEVPEADRQFSFNHKSKHARFWIVFGGPLANFIFAYVIFFSLFMSGERVPELRVGVVPSKSILYKNGLRSADELKKINGVEVYNPTEIPLEDDSIINTITVKRGDSDIELKVNLVGEKFFNEFMNISPYLRNPILVNSEGSFYALSTDPNKADFTLALDEILQLENLEKIYLFKITNYDEKNLEKIVEFTTDKNAAHSWDTNGLRGENLLKMISEHAYYPVDIRVKSVNMKSAADLAGLKAGDILTSINGKNIPSFEDLRVHLQATDGGPVKFSVLRDGKTLEKELTPDTVEANGVSKKLIGVFSSITYLPKKFIMIPSRGLFDSLTLSFTRTGNTISQTFNGYKKLITGQVSLKNIGGPITIGKVASDSFNTSLSYFFQIMALISVNLGIINLFPIPILDGGHIMFIIFEIFNRGPLSQKKMQLAQQFGLSFLLLLTCAALFNDFSRLF